ncbi:hypothetical protein TNCT_508661 [Trichonephila clavata]|uniref:Uncharacterized protein n=1 Tax=Trichonephila clavata TaxID=2740835 RepID=A0A8X6GIV5_TRICU|nr:hypothetical protein TNCT_508661 [Trichonephila clavata]
MYTDDSSMPGTGETGAAYCCQDFQGYSAVGALLSNYDGEVAAIHSAASQLENCNNPAKVVFLVDSQAAIRIFICSVLEYRHRPLTMVQNRLNFSDVIVT